MARLFPYDILKLIELIESKPCLWDKTSDAFKSKLEKQKAWREIYTFFEEDFLYKDKKEQEKIGEAISKKWQNIRDSFIKSLKRKSRQSTTRRYIYHDNLSFLLKVVQSDDAQSSTDESPDDEHSRQNGNQDEGEETEVEIKVEEKTKKQDNKKANESRNVPRRTRLQDDNEGRTLRALKVKKLRLQDVIGRRVLKTPEESRNSIKRSRLQDDIDDNDRQPFKASKNQPDEDEAFFISITPVVRKFSEDEKLEFRMNVLQLISDIKKQKNNQQQTFSNRLVSSSPLPPISFAS